MENATEHKVDSSAFGTEEEAAEGERRQEERREPMGQRTEASAFFFF